MPGKFKVLAGLHEEKTDNGVVRYGTGDVVESDLDLDKLFANKFVRVHDESGKPAKTKRPRDLTEDLDTQGGGGKVMDTPGHRAANQAAGAEPGEDEDEEFLEEEAEGSPEDGVSTEDDGGPEEEAQPVKKLAKKAVAKKKAK